MEITKWEYIDLNGYVRSKQDPGRFFEIDRDPEGYDRKCKRMFCRFRKTKLLFM